MKKEEKNLKSSITIEDFLLRQSNGGILSFSNSLNKRELDIAILEGRYYYDCLSGKGYLYKNTPHIFYPMNIYPPCDNEDFSIWVLIYDCSESMSYSLGYYDFEFKKWTLLNFEKDEFQMCCWCFVPVLGAAPFISQVTKQNDIESN